MATVNWDEKLSTDIPNIDNQHKQLVAMINKISDAMKNSTGNSILLEVLTELIEYTKTHFRYEEQYMEKIKYPKLKEHKDVHDHIVKQVSELYDKVSSGKYVSTVKISNMLKEWISDHILKVDMHYAKYTKYINEKQAAGV